MTWVTMFPPCTNSLLLKDVGMIPYMYYKQTGNETSIACYLEKKEFPFLKKEVNGVQVNEIKKYTGRVSLDGIFFLIKNARKIDILQLYHLTSTYNYWWVRIYKLLNPKGKVYLKLDTNYSMLNMILSKTQKWLVNNIELISTEILDVAARLEVKWQREILYVPNGVYWENNEIVNWKDKKDIILTVGRIGTFQKNTEMLLDIFADYHKINDKYSLRIIGPIEEGFEDYINDFFERNPQLKNKVIFVGDIGERYVLEEEYRRAKYFMFTSRWESFGIAMAEALMAGCYIISSEVDSLQSIIDDNKYGMGFPLKNIDKGIEALISASDRTSIECEQTCQAGQIYAREKFSWEKIIQPVIEALEK